MNIRRGLLPFEFLRNVWKEFKNMFYVKNSKSVLIVILIIVLNYAVF